MSYESTQGERGTYSTIRQRRESNMDHKAIAQRFAEADLRIEQILYLAGENPLAASDAFERFVEDHSGKEIRNIFGRERLGDWVEDEDEIEPEELLEALHDTGLIGFLVQFGRAVRKYSSPASYFSSWGTVQLNWIYAETLEAAIRRAHAWNDRMAKRDREKSLKAA